MKSRQGLQIPSWKCTVATAAFLLSCISGFGAFTDNWEGRSVDEERLAVFRRLRIGNSPATIKLQYDCIQVRCPQSPSPLLGSRAITIDVSSSKSASNANSHSICPAISVSYARGPEPVSENVEVRCVIVLQQLIRGELGVRLHTARPVFLTQETRRIEAMSQNSLFDTQEQFIIGPFTDISSLVSDSIKIGEKVLSCGQPRLLMLLTASDRVSLPAPDDLILGSFHDYLQAVDALLCVEPHMIWSLPVNLGARTLNASPAKDEAQLCAPMPVKLNAEIGELVTKRTLTERRLKSSPPKQQNTLLLTITGKCAEGVQRSSPSYLQTTQSKGVHFTSSPTERTFRSTRSLILSRETNHGTAGQKGAAPIRLKTEASTGGKPRVSVLSVLDSETGSASAGGTGPRLFDVTFRVAAAISDGKMPSVEYQPIRYPCTLDYILDEDLRDNDLFAKGSAPLGIGCNISELLPPGELKRMIVANILSEGAAMDGAEQDRNHRSELAWIVCTCPFTKEAYQAFTTMLQDEPGSTSKDRIAGLLAWALDSRQGKSSSYFVYYAAYHLYRETEYEESLVYVDRYLKEYQEHHDRLYMLKALSLSSSNRSRDALAILEKIRSDYPDSSLQPKARFFAAWLHLYDQQPEKAKPILQALTKEYPDSDYAKKAMQLLEGLEARN